MNTFNINLPLTNDQFRNKIPDFWVGDELATVMDFEMVESKVGELYEYNLQANIGTNKEPPYKVFAIDRMLRPYEPVDVTEYVTL